MTNRLNALIIGFGIMLFVGIFVVLFSLDPASMIPLLPPLALAVIIGLIPAAIAENKGHSFGTWWVFGAALFIVALPLSIWGIENKRKNIVREQVTSKPAQSTSNHDATEKIKKIAELKDEGILTKEEFQKKKEELLTKL